MSKIILAGSVGERGADRPADVRAIQTRLNEVRPESSSKLAVTGTVTPEMISMIRDFQKRVVGLQRPDGRIDPGGRTLAFLNRPDAASLWADRQPAAPPVARAEGKHIIYLLRRWQTAESTIGEFIIPDATGQNEVRQGFILERPGPDTVASGRRLRIPEGNYALTWQHQTKLGGVKPYLPVPWLSNAQVPSGRCIYIHNGNYPRNSDGCLLVGASRGKDFVGTSVATLKRLKTYLERVGITNVTLKISSDYA